jgi:hypothetical protein
VATEANTTAKIANQAATLGIYAAVGLVAAALTIAVTAGTYKVMQLTGAIKDTQTYTERLASGWARLKSVFTGENVSFTQNEKDLESEIGKVRATNAEAVVRGTMTSEQADAANRAGELRLRNQFAKEQLRVGDKSGMTRNVEAMRGLNTPAMAAMPSMSSMPAAVMPATDPAAAAVAEVSKKSKAVKESTKKTAGQLLAEKQAQYDAEIAEAKTDEERLSIERRYTGAFRSMRDLSAARAHSDRATGLEAQLNTLKDAEKSGKRKGRGGDGEDVVGYIKQGDRYLAMTKSGFVGGHGDGVTSLPTGQKITVKANSRQETGPGGMLTIFFDIPPVVLRDRMSRAADTL